MNNFVRIAFAGSLAEPLTDMRDQGKIELTRGLCPMDRLSSHDRNSCDPGNEFLYLRERMSLVGRRRIKPQRKLTFARWQTHNTVPQSLVLGVKIPNAQLQSEARMRMEK
jgi:hypothetical protein